MTIVEPAHFSHSDARRRWAELIRPIYAVDPLVYPQCGGTMRVNSLLKEPMVIDKILKHLREEGRVARAGPWATASPSGDAMAEAAHHPQLPVNLGRRWGVNRRPTIGTMGLAGAAAGARGRSGARGWDGEGTWVRSGCAG